MSWGILAVTYCIKQDSEKQEFAKGLLRNKAGEVDENKYATNTENPRYSILDHTLVEGYQNILSKLTDSKIYASKTLRYLKDDGTLTPIGIMLQSQGHGESDEKEKQLFYPADKDVEGVLWKLAKAFVLINDSSYHPLVSHWLMVRRQ